MALFQKGYFLVLKCSLIERKELLKYDTQGRDLTLCPVFTCLAVSYCHRTVCCALSNVLNAFNLR